MSDLSKNTLKITKRASNHTLSTIKPDLPEDAILFTLAEDGPMTQTKLDKTIDNYGKWESDHHTIKRRLSGLKYHFSLINYEFVKEREPEIRKPGRYGKVYCLTTKGFLAALSTGISFERTDMFKKYITFLDEILCRKIKYIGNDAGFDSTLDTDTKEKILDIVTNYIKYQMIVFLIWHEANEISIRKKRKSNWYIEDFVISHNEFINQEFPMLLDKKQEEEYRQILREYFAYSKILHLLMEMPTDDKHNKKINDNLKMISSFVYKWYLYFDELQMRNPIGEKYSITNIPSLILSRPEYGIDIEYEGRVGSKRKIQPDLKIKTKNQLEEILNRKVLIEDIWRKPFDRNIINNELFH